jgi:hypothetical protein
MVSPGIGNILALSPVQIHLSTGGAVLKPPVTRGVQSEVGVNFGQVVSFCPTILGEQRTTKTSKTSKKQRQRDSLLEPHMGGLRPATLPGRCGKTQDVQERNERLGIGAFFHSARARSRAREAPAHVWFQKRIPPSPELIDMASMRDSWRSSSSLRFALSLPVCRVRRNRHYPARLGFEELEGEK